MTCCGHGMRGQTVELLSQSIPHYVIHADIICVYNQFIPLSVMRLIERQMNQAIRYRKNFNKDNTSVRCFKTNGITTDIDVYLHGNHIASLETATNKLTIKDGGWQTVTTKSRLNALLDEFAYGMRVFQRDFIWYLDDRFGITQPFISGMTV